ncbi:MAG: 50S ribosomal protein L6 [Acholeplasmatales bacterium]|jgi:large subunit ribosomal protein L6|nr:50S ribosomal protein L6 [Acholeplasmatales bacterium]
MSRIGNKIINIPAGVEVIISENNHVVVKANKIELSNDFNPLIKITKEGSTIKLERPNDLGFTRKIHGTTRALLANMVTGVGTGFKKQLEIQGVGYKAAVEGSRLVLNVGFSHPVYFEISKTLKVETPKPTDIIVSGSDKQEVGQFAAVVRATCKPEPYKGKGIRYVGETVRRKAGKTAK